MTSSASGGAFRSHANYRITAMRGWKYYCVCCFLLISQSASANPKSLANWIDFFKDRGQAVFYSSDYLSPSILNQSLYLPAETLAAFNTALNQSDLQLIAIDPSVWVIKPMQKSPTYITVVKAIDADTDGEISSFQGSFIQNPPQSSHQNALIINNSVVLSQPITLKATGYYPLIQQLSVKQNQNNIITVRLQPLPLALSDMRVSTSQLYFENQNNSQQTLNREDLDRQGVFNNDPLRSGERLASHAGSGINGRAHVRGGQRNETYIELDGMPLRNPYHFKDFAALFSTINPNVVNSVSHYSGVFPAQYGGRLSAVMTVDSDNSEIDNQQITDLSLLSLSHTSRVNTEHSERLYSLRTGGQLLGSSLISNIDIEPEFEDGYFKWKQNISPRWSSSQHLLVSRDELDIQQDEEQANAAYHDLYAWLKFEYDNLANHQSQWQLAYTRHHNQRQGVINDTFTRGWLDEDLLSRHLALSWDHQWRINNDFELSFGATLKESNADLSAQRAANHNPFWANLLNVPVTFERHYQNTTEGMYWSYYSNLRWQWHDHWVADIGLYNEQAQWLPHQGISPRVNVAYLPNTLHQWRFGLGRHQQAQRIDELLYADAQPVYEGAASADIAVIDYRYRISPNLKFRAEAYYKKYSNTLPYYDNLFSDYHLLPELYADYQRITPDDARARGLEITFQGQYRTLQWSASYTLADVIDEINEHEIPRSWQQRHTLKTAIGFPIGQWNLDFAMQQNSGWPTTEVIQVNEDLILTERNTQNRSEFFQLDANISRQWRTSYGQWRMQIQLQNALNINNPCCTEYEYNNNLLSSETKSVYPLVPNIRWTLVW